MKVLFLGADFMAPFFAPEVEQLVVVDLHHAPEPQIEPHRDAVFAYAMNTIGGENVSKLWAARDVCTRLGIPTVWSTVEDPNSFGTFFQQAAGFDVICTSDEVMIPRYLDWYPGAKVIWLPLAAQPAIHKPLPITEDAADFVLIANWYTNDARLAAVRTVLDPIIDAGFSLNLYAYATPTWPAKYRRFWRGATSCYDVATYYATGRIVLGMNNQAWGTAMCSMRTFEVLACGKPFLSFHSDAYEKLGFINDALGIEPGHFVWTDDATNARLAAADLLADPAHAAAMAERGRQFVLAHHTYRHRLETLLAAVGGGVPA